VSLVLCRTYLLQAILLVLDWCESPCDAENNHFNGCLTVVQRCFNGWCTCSDDASAEASEALRRSGDKLATNAAVKSADNSNSDQQHQQQQAAVSTENMTPEVCTDGRSYRIQFLLVS
jgi:hypothetical protein